MIVALNSMFAGSEFVAPSNTFSAKANQSQRLCIDRLRRSVLQLGKPPAHVTGQGALVELRAGLGYTGQTLPASLAGYQKDLVSLPEVGDVPSSLDFILRPQAESVVGTLRSKLFSSGEVDAKRENCLIRSPYFDPILKHQKKVYSDFILRLHASSLIEFRTQARESAGVFFVWKKSGRQRMVIDARHSNLWFGNPEKVHLATGTAFSRIQVDDGPPIEVGGVDISDAFYRIELPSEFRDLFALRALPAKAVGLTAIGGVPLQPEQQVFPCLRVVPMGWTQALWVCQRCHECVTDSLTHIPASLRFIR